MEFETISQFIVSATVVVLAARWLAHASDELARATGLSHLFIGSLFLAASTSSPEFFVDIRATLDGLPNLASGDLLGSSLMNLIIFSLLAFTHSIALKPTGAVGIGMTALLAAILTAEIGVLIFFQPEHQVLGFNAGSFLVMGTYLAGMRFVFKKTKGISSKTTSPTVRRSKILRPISQFFLATTILFFASPLLVSSMKTISLKTGMDATFLGATLLALTTSLPELISSMTAIRMGLFDLVIGNIIGSNALNMVIFVFMDWIWTDPPLWSHLSAKNLLLCGAVVLNMLIVAITWRRTVKAKPWIKKLGTVLIFLISVACYVALYLLKL